ncbi:hypothetical protein KEC56_05205 [Microbacterium sp. YMB-B2]|uniref:Uncharacterized protein n=1 Tax=Microbacterium tenebrionis TaxID=2830665 RepID=A0A9X1S0N7_9MICO|nr:hypothetical protein [Microbacterium tenebrionis]MCC2028918.1 hypothetical protein [Microbacterium tenebrionis]
MVSRRGRGGRPPGDSDARERIAAATMHEGWDVHGPLLVVLAFAVGRPAARLADAAAADAIGGFDTSPPAPRSARFVCVGSGRFAQRPAMGLPCGFFSGGAQRRS